MNKKPRCKNCNHYYKFPEQSMGQCLWYRMHILPSIMLDQDYWVSPKDGKYCQTWLPRDSRYEDAA